MSRSRRRAELLLNAACIAPLVFMGFVVYASRSSVADPAQHRTPEVITVTSYDASGEAIVEHFDAHPSVVHDIFGTGVADLNFDGTVDLADLNILLPLMGTDYREATSP